MIIFTPEQAKLIHKTKDIGPLLLNPDELLIADGVVNITDSVWWNCSEGPVIVSLDKKRGHFGNATQFPHLYSINKPAHSPEEDPDDC